MSCTCQVKDRDQDKPCPVCGDDPASRAVNAEAESSKREEERLRTLQMMMRPRMAPRPPKERP